MNFSTVGNFYYSGYTLVTCVTDDVSTLNCNDAEAFYKIIYSETGTCGSDRIEKNSF